MESQDPTPPETFLYTQSFLFSRPMKDGDGTFEFGVAAGADYLASHFKSITYTPEQHAAKIAFVAKRSKGLTPSREAMLERIVTRGNGKLPMRISAPPQGIVFRRDDGSLGFPLLKMESTSEPELPLFMETFMEEIMWYAPTVATKATRYRMLSDEALAKTVDPVLIPYIEMSRIWDFSGRGMTSPMTSAIGGHSALFAIDGTDTDAGSDMAEKLFSPDFDASGNEIVIGQNVDTALEHADMMKYGKDGEIRVIMEACDDTDGGILAFPVDTVNMSALIDKLTLPGSLRNRLFARFNPSKVLNINSFRPDSCLPDPETGMKMSHPQSIVAILNQIEQNTSDLPKGEGVTVNSMGYKVLPTPPNKAAIRIVYGDSLTEETIKAIYAAMISAGWSAENIIFGVGGNLAQRGLDRGMLDVAQKPVRYVSVTMKDHEITRNLKKYTTGKESPTGPQKLVKLDDGTYRMVSADDAAYPQPDEMRVIYDYSYGMPEPVLYNRDSLGTIRTRVQNFVKKEVYTKLELPLPTPNVVGVPTSTEIGEYGPIFKGTLPPFAENFAMFVDFYKNTQSLDSIGHLNKSDPAAVEAYAKQAAALPEMALAVSKRYG